jgi:hypothetical protein
LSGESVTGLDTEAFGVVVSSVSRCVDERRVSGVAVTRQTVFFVSAVLVGRVDEDRKLDSPAVTVECRRQIVVDDAAPPLREFLLDRLPPADDRQLLGVVVCLQQRETLAVEELPVKIDCRDVEVTGVEETEKLSRPFLAK